MSSSQLKALLLLLLLADLKIVHFCFFNLYHFVLHSFLYYLFFTLSEYCEKKDDDDDKNNRFLPYKTYFEGYTSTWASGDYTNCYGGINITSPNVPAKED